MEIRILIFLIFFLPYTIFSMDIQDMNFSKLKEHSKIEVVTYQNGKQNISLVSQEKPSFYTPTEKTLIFRKPPKIIHNSYGTFWLYDLTKDGSYLNALSYDYLLLEGNLSHISVGISDKNYFTKDDHFKVKTQNKYVLKKLFKSIDLSQLKYLVLHSTHTQVVPLTSFQFIKKTYSHTPKKNKLSTWAWHPKNITKNNLAKQPIQKLYIQMKDGFTDALKTIASTHKSVYGLNGSPQNIFNYAHLLADIKKLALLKKTFPFIEGYQIDVEPYLVKDFKIHKLAYLEKYLSMVKVLKQHTSQYGLKLSVAIPFWFDQLYLNNKNVGFSIIKLVDEIAIMSYRSNLHTAISLSQNSLNYAAYLEKDIYIGVELMKIEDEQYTNYEVVKKNISCLTHLTLSSECLLLKKINEYTLFGTQISFYNQTEKLKDIQNYQVDYDAFKGFILHHYDILNTLPTLNP